MIEPPSRKGIGGPKTPEGKLKVSLNAMKHGLRAESPQAQQCISKSLGASFDEVHNEMRAYYRPADPVEDLLVKRIARCAWRILLTQAMEDKILDTRTHLSISRTYEKIFKHERLIDIHLHRAISSLAKKREDDRAAVNLKPIT